MVDQNSLSGVVSGVTRAFATACQLSSSIEVRATHRGSGEEHTFFVRHPTAIIGRTPTAAVKLDDPSVSQFHALLQVIEGVPYCVDLGSRTGVAWGDTPRACGWVTGGQALRVGAFDLWVVHPSAEVPPVGGARAGGEPGDDAGLRHPTLEVYPSNGGVGSVVTLDRPLVMLGRHPNCQLRLIDAEVGYFHAYLVNTPGGVWWVELPMRQSGRLNGRHTRLARLADGDLIEIGRLALVFRVAGGGDRPAGDGHTAGIVRAQPAGGHYPPADPGGGDLAPMRDVMEQFQRCLTTMAGMFTAMQQDHMNLMCEQMRLVQDLAKELRDLRGETHGRVPATAAPPSPPPPVAPTPPPQATAAPPPPVPRPTPQVSAQADQAALTDAHAWFLSQLSKFDQPATPPKT